MESQSEVETRCQEETPLQRLAEQVAKICPRGISLTSLRLRHFHFEFAWIPRLVSTRRHLQLYDGSSRVAEGSIKNRPIPLGGRSLPINSTARFKTRRVKKSYQNPSRTQEDA